MPALPGIQKGHAMDLIFTVATGAALALGFLAGLLIFKRSLQWCRTCGATLTCAECVWPATDTRKRPTESARSMTAAEQVRDLVDRDGR